MSLTLCLQPLASFCHKVRRTLDEARPYFPLFPFKEAIPARFLGGGRE